jgi:hypothetical protein
MQAAITPPPPVPTETRPPANGQPPPPAIPSSSKPKGMQLGAHKTSVPSSFPGGLAEEARWSGDLMDVNADADDWSMYPLLTGASHTLIEPVLSYTQMHSRAPQQNRVALTPSRWAGPMRWTTRTRGVRSKIPHRHLCLFPSRNLHRRRYLPDLHHHQLHLLRGRLPPRPGGPRESQRYHPLRARA